MARQWGRFFRLTASGGSGGTLDLSDFRVEFEIRDQSTQSPRTAVITIYNLSEQTAQALPKTSGKVSIEVGYEDGYGRLFSGDVKQRHLGRASPTETYATLYAADGDRAYTQAMVSKSLKAGSTGKDIYQACIDAMKPFGISAGNVPSVLSQQKDPRAQALFGMGRDVLRKMTLALGCTWKIQDGKLNVVKAGEALPGDTIVLNSNTGMIGRPVQTDQGIIARALINPALHVHGRVKIDERSIDRAAFNLSVGGEPLNAEPNLGTIATDGVYSIQALNITGDSRGNPWYCDLICNALGAGVTTGSANLGRT